ncbi:MAG: class I SAM-dependent methyltransferase [Myxococcales bacterium]|nr:class I SAM-dependent methyltransferase [Myxococcales bacterium]
MAKRRPVIDDVDAVRDAGARAHYDDPAYYDLAYRARRRDVAYYVSVAKRHGGPVLEYGVGNGRVAISLARSGFEVVGVDLSEAMLKSLDAKLRRAHAGLRELIEPVHGDMRSVRLRRRFPLVIAPFNTVLHLYERRDIEEFFARVREHLAPGGRFVFDFSLPAPADLALDPNRAFSAPSFKHPITKRTTRYRERFEYHPLRQLLVVWMEMTPSGGAEASSVPLSHRQFFPREMEALLHYNGFSDLRFTADFSDDPPGPDADSLVASATVAGRPNRGRPVARGRSRA